MLTLQDTLLKRNSLSKIPNTDLTPLSLACSQGHLDMVKYLVDEKSIDPLCEMDDRTTPFHLACQEGHLEIVKFFIEEKGCDPLYYHEKTRTPYGMACAGGHLDVVRYLTEERHCDPLCKDNEGVPVVLTATVINNIDVLKYFVEERGCDLKASGEYENALIFAIQSGSLQAFQYLSTGRSSASKLYIQLPI